MKALMQNHYAWRKRSTGSILAGVIALVGIAYAGIASALPPIDVLPEARLEPFLPELPGIEDSTPLHAPEYRPGFVLATLEGEERKQIAEFEKLLEARAWGEAFRLLSELERASLNALMPDARGVTLRSPRKYLRQRLLALPPEGLAAFRLYFDGQANELFDLIRDHPLPGSHGQLQQLQTLIDRFVAASIGGEAAMIAGELYFKIGEFARADMCWRLAIDHGSLDAAAASQLQVKRVLALHRAGETRQANELLDQLKARYDKLTLTIGDNEVNALPVIEQAIGGAGAEVLQHEPGPGPLWVPKPDAVPAWHMTFIPQADRARISASSSNTYYRGPEDIKRVVARATADDARVYFAWLDAVFALDRQTGKILWKQRTIGEQTNSIRKRLLTNTGDPRNYQLTLAGDVLLATGAPGFEDSSNLLSMTAYDKATGDIRWSTRNHGSWQFQTNNQSIQRASVLGQALVDGAEAYTVTHVPGSPACVLVHFKPNNGEVLWRLPLGSAAMISFPYTNVNRMPQPIMLKGSGLLYVLIGNGAMLAIDTASQQIAWAIRMKTPADLETTSKTKHSDVINNQLDAFSNPNGSGALLLQDDVLYAKQHLGSRLYAVDAQTGATKSIRKNLAPDAKPVGIDQQAVYLMNQTIAAYPLDTTQVTGWANRKATNAPDQASAIVEGGRVLLLGAGRLAILDIDRGQAVTTYDNTRLLGQSGGFVYRFGDLLVCTSRTGITAFRQPAVSGPASD